MQKEIFFTPEEMQIIRVCLHNAPIPYDQGEGAKELKVLQEKVGPPIPRKDDLEALLKIEIQRRVKHFIFDFKVQARNGFAKTRV